MSSLFAFLHHIAAFTLISALVVECVLLREAVTVSTARKILATDAIFGISAGIILVIGLIRVFYFEKGAGYYFSNGPFLVKLTLFALIGCLSIYPTKQFLSWRPATKTGQEPTIGSGTLRKLRTTIYLEMTAAVFLILCAALMTRGIGSF